MDSLVNKRNLWLLILFIFFALPQYTVELLNVTIEFVTQIKFMRPDSVIGSTGLILYYILALISIIYGLVKAIITIVKQNVSSSLFYWLVSLSVVLGIMFSVYVPVAT